jgi:hypothetical protein
VTATARKIAVLFYNAVRHGMQYVDPGASFYETRYRTRVINNLHRRAKAFGFVLQPMEVTPWGRRFLGIVFERQLADLCVQRLHIDRRLCRSAAPRIQQKTRPRAFYLERTKSSHSRNNQTKKITPAPSRWNRLP